MPKTILIAGGTGLIGSAIQEHAVQNEWKVTLLSRKPGPDSIVWDPAKNFIDLPDKMSFDAIINLAGTNLSDGRWTRERKKDIYNSRMQSCRTLENYLFDGRLSTNVYIGASAIGIYGDSGSRQVNENTPVKADDWYSGLVRDWEKEHNKMKALEIRTVILRMGLIMTEKAGALPEILKTRHFGIIPFFGNGKQMWPWIHIDDVVGMMFYCIENKNMEGVYLATGPKPVSNKEFTKVISSTLKGPHLLVPVPRFVVRLMVGEMHRVVFDSCNAKPEKMIKTGYPFKFPDAYAAAKDIAIKFGKGNKGE